MQVTALRPLQADANIASSSFVAAHAAWQLKSSHPAQTSVRATGSKNISVMSGSLLAASGAALSAAMWTASARRKASSRVVLAGLVKCKSGRVDNSPTGSLDFEVEPFPNCTFGGNITGYDLRTVLGDDAATRELRKKLASHRLLVFRGQHEFTGADHIALSEQLGSMDHGLHFAHPRAPDRRLLRVSNDKEEGFVQVGTSGWHVDGVMLRAPFSVQTMHFVSAIPGGDTLFLDLGELLEALAPDELDRIRRLWFLSGVGDNLGACNGQLSILPLVYEHPVTKRETMCFHLGGKYCLGWIKEEPPASGIAGFIGSLLGGGDDDYELFDVLQPLLTTGKTGQDPTGFSVLPPEPTLQALRDLIVRFGKKSKQRAIWRQEWASGDVAIIDNLALAHLPAPGTQASRDDEGLRLFHRTTMVDSGWVPRNARGADSVLLVAGAAATAPEGTDQAASRAGAVCDPGAMRAIVRALAQVSASADGTGDSNTEPPPTTSAQAAVKTDTGRRAAARLRQKARAKLAPEKQGSLP